MTSVKDALGEIVKSLEAVAANVGAMESALVARGFLTLEETDAHRPDSLVEVKSALANARWMISQLSD